MLSTSSVATAPGEIVTLYVANAGPPNVVSAARDASGRLPAIVGDTRVLFDGVPAAMIYSSIGQVSAIVPSGVSATTQIQVEYLGVAGPAVTVPVATAAPGIFACDDRPDVAVVVNASAGGSISCAGDFKAPGPGSVVTFFVTGVGEVTLTDPANPSATGLVFVTVPPLQVLFGDVEAQQCAASFRGMVSDGVVQVNTCVPLELTQGAVTLRVVSGGISSKGGVFVDLRGPS